MHEDDTNNSSAPGDGVIDLAMKKLHMQEQSADDPQISKSVCDGPELTERRKFPRAVFTYPVEFRLLSQSPEHASYNGYLKDISLVGACLLFEDKYGRLSLNSLDNAKIKISFSIPRGGRAGIFAEIRWVKKDTQGKSVSMGIEFKDMESWQMEAVEKLIGMKNKDHNMIWNLWEQYGK